MKKLISDLLFRLAAFIAPAKKHEQSAYLPIEVRNGEVSVYGETIGLAEQVIEAIKVLRDVPETASRVFRFTADASGEEARFSFALDSVNAGFIGLSRIRKRNQQAPGLHWTKNLVLLGPLGWEWRD